jgi:hypothetical protein
MPNVSNTRRYNSAFVNVRVRTTDDIGSECGICLKEWCEDDACNRTMTQTKCCIQGACSACITKISMICKCEDNCPNVIFICPFCRNLSKVEPVTLFLGTKRPCKKCRDNDNPPAVVESPEIATSPDE